MPEYTKITKDHLVFFIRSEFLPVANDGDDLPLLMKSDIVLDTRSNTVIKCRYSLDKIVALFLENK